MTSAATVPAAPAGPGGQGPFGLVVVVLDGAPVVVAGGVESVSLVGEHLNTAHDDEAWLRAYQPALWMPMIDTAA